MLIGNSLVTSESSKKMKILINGPQGSGKTTQAKMLVENLGLCLVKTGDLVREKAKEDSEEGKALAHSLDTGVLSDDRVVAELVKKELKREECKEGFVIDGYPRRMSQLEEYDPEYDKVFYLELSDEVAVKRMLERGRDDDTPELIKERLQIFREETEKVVKYYEEKGILIRIDGEKGVDEVHQEIMKHLRV